MKEELQNMLDSCAAELTDIATRMEALPPLDKSKKYLTNYALIRSCGTAEFVYRSIVADYFLKLSDSRIDTYLDASIRKGSMSATYNNMMGLLGKFDEQWKKDFQQAVKDSPDKDKLINASNSLVTNRHSFAHGKPPTATFSEIKQYYADITVLIHIFDSIVR